MAVLKSKIKGQHVVNTCHPRKKGNLFTIDAEAVLEAREFGSSFSTLNLDFDSDSDSDSLTFFCDTFRGLSSSSMRPRSRTSSMKKESRDGSRKRSRNSVSFATNIATVHEVDNLKLILSRDEKKELWAPKQENSSSKLTALEQSLYESFCVGDERLLRTTRKDNKRRRRKSQSKLRQTNQSSSYRI